MIPELLFATGLAFGGVLTLMAVEAFDPMPRITSEELTGMMSEPGASTRWLDAHDEGKTVSQFPTPPPAAAELLAAVKPLVPLPSAIAEALQVALVSKAERDKLIALHQEHRKLLHAIIDQVLDANT